VQIPAIWAAGACTSLSDICFAMVAPVNDVLEVPFSAKTRNLLRMLAENRSRKLSSLLPLSIVVAAFAVLTIAVGVMSRAWTAIGFGLGLAALAGLGLWRRHQASAIAPAPIPEFAFSIDDQQIHFIAVPGTRATTTDWALAETTLEVRPGGRALAFSREGERTRRFSLAGLDIDPNQLISFFDSHKAACSGGSAPARELLNAARPASGPEPKFYETPMLAWVFPLISVLSFVGGAAIPFVSILGPAHTASHTKSLLDPTAQIWMLALIMIAVAVEMQRRHFAFTKYRWRNDSQTMLYWVLIAVAIVGALVGPALVTAFYPTL
jgi:hypothetical protein